MRKSRKITPCMHFFIHDVHMKMHLGHLHMCRTPQEHDEEHIRFGSDFVQILV